MGAEFRILLKKWLKKRRCQCILKIFHWKWVSTDMACKTRLKISALLWFGSTNLLQCYCWCLCIFGSLVPIFWVERSILGSCGFGSLYWFNVSFKIIIDVCDFFGSLYWFNNINRCSWFIWKFVFQCYCYRKKYL